MSARGSRPAHRVTVPNKPRRGPSDLSVTPRVARYFHWGTFERGRRAKKNVNDPSSLFHAFEHESANPRIDEVGRFTRSLCGRWPRNGWGSDLYLDEYCQHCVTALFARMGRVTPGEYRRISDLLDRIPPFERARMKPWRDNRRTPDDGARSNG